MAGYRARQIAVGLAAEATSALFAQQPQPPPAFRSEIHDVQIPARVLDARGYVVARLTRSGFTIVENTVATVETRSSPPNPVSATRSVVFRMK